MEKNKKNFSIEENLRFMYMVHEAEREIKKYNLTDRVNEMINLYGENKSLENRLLNMINFI